MLLPRAASLGPSGRPPWRLGAYFLVFAAFQQMHREAKALQKKARPRVAAARRIVEPCVVGADFMGHMAESPGLEMERRGS